MAFVRTVLVRAGRVCVRAALRETPTADALWAALPIYSDARVWGEEVYFAVPVDQPREAGAKAIVTAGELAFWPDGHAVAIGYGPTPISVADEIRLASPCNIWGDALDDVRALTNVKAGERVAMIEADS